MKEHDLENAARAVSNLIDGIAVASGHDRWYVGRLVVDIAQRIVAAEYRDWLTEKERERANAAPYA